MFLWHERKAGPPHIREKTDILVPGNGVWGRKNYSEETAREIDGEVKKVITANYERVKKLLEENRTLLDALAKKLEEKEVLSGEEVEAIVKQA